jgi:hypothetical protein
VPGQLLVQGGLDDGLGSIFSSPSGPVRDSPRSFTILTSSWAASASVVSVWLSTVLVLGKSSGVAAISGSFPSGLPPGLPSRIDRYFHSPDWIDAGARGTVVADCQITSSVRTPRLSECMQASQAAKAAVAG